MQENVCALQVFDPVVRVRD